MTNTDHERESVFMHESSKSLRSHSKNDPKTRSLTEDLLSKNAGSAVYTYYISAMGQTEEWVWWREKKIRSPNGGNCYAWDLV